MARALNLLTRRRVSDKIATCVIGGFSTGEKLHSLAYVVQQVANFFFFWSSTYS